MLDVLIERKSLASYRGRRRSHWHRQHRLLRRGRGERQLAPSDSTARVLGGPVVPQQLDADHAGGDLQHHRGGDIVQLLGFGLEPEPTAGRHRRDGFRPIGGRGPGETRGRLRPDPQCAHRVGRPDRQGRLLSAHRSRLTGAHRTGQGHGHLGQGPRRLRLILHPSGYQPAAHAGAVVDLRQGDHAAPRSTHRGPAAAVAAADGEAAGVASSAADHPASAAAAHHHGAAADDHHHDVPPTTTTTTPPTTTTTTTPPTTTTTTPPTTTTTTTPPTTTTTTTVPPTTTTTTIVIPITLPL